jgi:ABC-type antimicrobial peptide transport system permease subunit
MFGKLMHPTVELCVVLIVVSSLFVAQSAIIVKVANDEKTDYVIKGESKYNFAVALLVVAVLVLVYGLAFLGMDLFEKYSN